MNMFQEGASVTATNDRGQKLIGHVAHLVEHGGSLLVRINLYGTTSTVEVDYEDFSWEVLEPKQDKQYTINDISRENRGAIMVWPTSDGEDGEWHVYIPQTVPLEDDEEPYGVESWSTLRAALTSLSMYVRQGNLKYNDGRTVE